MKLFGVRNLGLAIVLTATVFAPTYAQDWSDEEKEELRSLWIDSLAATPNDPSNLVDNNARAVMLGHRLFFDKQFSGDGEVSCASCHRPELWFTDGLPLAKGMGTTSRHTQTIVGTAHSPWLFWDGRKDSQWSQALGPMESPVEHGGTRVQFAKILVSDPSYRQAYEEIFGALPDILDSRRFPTIAAPNDVSKSREAWEKMTPDDREMISRIFSNMGKAIAAYERLILPGASRFDRYVEAVLNGTGKELSNTFSDDEIAGLRLFVGKGNCIQCHNGPLFTNNDFHNTGVPSKPNLDPDRGRAGGVKAVRADEFNCLGSFSDAGAGDCAELKFMQTESSELLGKFKVATLRNISNTAPYMHSGNFSTLADVLNFYNNPPDAKLGQSELNQLNLNAKEISQMGSFLKTLAGPVDAQEKYLLPPR
ncbi:MAG: cytochrome c peroxidase [Verrucomicrobiota bacterium]|nr:cytochrome c peroxidase [Verrucomicrobiota bacterium]